VSPRLARWRKVLRPLDTLDLLAATRDLTIPPPDIPLPPGVAARPATPEDLPHLAAVMEPYRAEIWDFRGEGALAAVFEQRLRAGDLCLIGELRGTIAYMGWTRFDEASLQRVGIHVTLREGEAYGYGVFALPAFRGQGLSTTVGVARLHWLREHGVRRFYGWVSASNVAILKVQTRLGYRTVASVRQIYWRVRRRLVLVNQVLYDPAIRWRSGARPAGSPSAGGSRSSAAAPGGDHLPLAAVRRQATTSSSLMRLLPRS